jgi:hypothetical protein
MANLHELIKNYEKADSSDLSRRAHFVLEMIEETITYPPPCNITNEELTQIDEKVQQLTQDLRKDKQYLFSVRILKIWRKREHLLQMAKIWHGVHDDYMDAIEYHQEIRWLRDERRRLASEMK